METEMLQWKNVVLAGVTALLTLGVQAATPETTA
jgi:hypothetical protein